MSDLMNKPWLAGELKFESVAVFTPCTGAGSLLEPKAETARVAAAGYPVRSSPAGSNFGRFGTNRVNRSTACCCSLESIRGGAFSGDHKMLGTKTASTAKAADSDSPKKMNLQRGLVREHLGANKPNLTSRQPNQHQEYE